MGQPSVRLTNVFRDGPSQRQIRRLKIHIEGDQGRSRADHDSAGRFMETGRATIRRPARIGGHAESKALKSSSTNRFEQGMIAVQGRLFIEEYRDLQLCCYPLSQLLRQMNTVLHRRAAHRHEGHDICGPHPRMDALVLPKIDEIGRHAKCAKGGFNDGVRFAGKAQDGAVVIPAAFLDLILAEGAEQERMEAWIVDEVNSGAALPGLYPMNAETKARYAATKK